MFQVDIWPKLMMSVDILLTEITGQAGAAALRSTSTVQAHVPAVTAQRHGLVQAVRATSSGVAIIPIVGAAGSGSGIVLSPTATASGAAPIPVLAIDGIVDAQVALSIGWALPVTLPDLPEDAIVDALQSSGSIVAPIPSASGESVVTTTGGSTYQNLSSGVGTRNGTTTHTIGHSTAATAPDAGCDLGFVPTIGRLLVVVVAAGSTHTSIGTGAGSGWTERQAPLGDAELSLFTKNAVGNDFITLTGSSNFPLAWEAYEFPAGSTYTNSSSETANDDTFPVLESLPGTSQFVIAAYARVVGAGTPTGGSTVSAPWVESFDSITGDAATDGIYFYTFNQIGFTGTSETPVFTYGVTGGTVSVNRQKVVAAFSVPEDGVIASSMMAMPPVVTGT